MKTADKPDMAKVAAAMRADGAPGLDDALELDAAIKLASERPAEWRRVRKWDRPPEPRDWRYFVGMAGRIMLATGILLFGFVAYQLWGTGIETARAQNALEDKFEAALAERAATDETADDDTATATDTGTGTGTGTATDGSAGNGAAGGDAAGGDGAPAVGSSDTGDTGDDAADGASTADATPPGDDTIDATVIPVAPDLADEAVEQDLPEISRGDVLARLEIPRIDEDMFVVPGVLVDDLKHGPGHYPDTPLPGQLGNSAIAGHRTTYGEPFHDVDKLQPGDELIVTMITGDQFVYEVTGIQVVEATDYWVVRTTNPDTAELTLTSCHPKYSARQRIIVRSVLNPDKSAQVGFPTTYELEAGDETPIPGDDPVIEADDPQVVAGEPATDDEPAADDDGVGAADDEATERDAAAATDAISTPDDDPAVRENAPAADAPADPPGVAADDLAADAAGDAFARGWFDDDEAWPQIMLWGLALTLISIISYRISRRFRRDLVGFSVGIVPFVISLYFFFQNVHRLLPPGI